MISNPHHGGDVTTSIPSIHQVNSHIANNSKLRVIGLRQKVNLISKQVCVAWAGTYIYARAFIKYLKQHCSNSKMSLAEYNKIIDAYPATDLGDLSIISYFHDGRGFGRRYINAPLFELEGFHDLQVAGTGTPTFIQAIEFLAATRLSGEYLSLGDALSRAISFTSYAFGNQILTGNGVIEGWGGAFEIAYPLEDRFEKLSNVLHLTWIVREQNNGKLEANCIPIFIKLNYQDERLIILVADYQDKSEGDRLYVIDPLFDIDTKQKINIPDLNYTWLVNHFHFERSDNAPLLYED